MKINSYVAACAVAVLLGVIGIVSATGSYKEGSAAKGEMEGEAGTIRRGKVASYSRVNPSWQAASSETVLLADDFTGSQIDTTKWSLNNLFSGFTNPGVAVADTGGLLQVGPLKQNASGSNYNGLRSAARYDFTGAYCYVELTGPPSASTGADAMFTVGTDVNNYYRMYVEAGSLVCQKKAAGTKTSLLTTAYDATAEKFFRIRNDSSTNSVVFETAPDAGGAPGPWTVLLSQPWDSAINLTGILFEIKAGTWRSESNDPGTVFFDNFRAAIPSSNPALNLASILPASGSPAGGSTVAISGSGFATGDTVSFGGVPATSVVVDSDTAISAVSPANALGAVDVTITGPDGQTATLANSYTYTDTPAFSHVFLIVEENHSYSTVIGNSVMPYLNSLASKYGLATQYFANTHPSIGNYFMLTTGQLISNDDSFAGTVTVDNVVRELITAGKTWKTYAESLPSVGYLGGDQYPYLKHHNPTAYFSDVINSAVEANNIVPFSQFGADLASDQLPAFSLIVPNAQDDAHDCPQGFSTCSDPDKLSAADNWLETNISPLVASSSFQNSGLLMIVFDESDSTDTTFGGGHVAMVVVSPSGNQSHKSTTFYQHQSTLKTLCEALRLGGFAGAASDAQDMSEFFGAQSSATTLLADNFDQGFIDTSKWSTNSLFSGFTDPGLSVVDTGQQLQIGPLREGVTGSHYNGLRSAASYDFTGAYCYVELVQPASASTAADAMLTIGKNVNNYYRIYVESGKLICQKKIGGVKTNLLTESYDAASSAYIRIRHDASAGNVVFETAPNNSGVPGAWTVLFSETWNTSAVPLTAVMFELKAGTWQSETNPPGTVLFDNFKAERP